MIEAHYTWRPLGALLVEKNVLTNDELEHALAEQRRTGRLLGEILVESGHVSGFSIARGLAEQHGVELGRTADLDPTTSPATPARPQPGPTGWRPLGKLLVEQGFLTRQELEEALAEQRASGGRRLLGEILVGSGVLSGLSLAQALGEQSGVTLAAGEDVDVRTVLKTSVPGQPLYEVREVVYGGGAPRPQEIVYRSPSFLEAADFAAEFVEDNNPEGVEIQRKDGLKRETVWTYSEIRAAETVASRKSLSETFGFDPTLWDGSDPRGPEGAARWSTGTPS